MKTNPNQPITAFTELDEQGRPYQFYKGLTKREHFAGLAMQGLLSIYDKHNITPSMDNIRHMANLSVVASDLIIEELNRTQD